MIMRILLAMTATAMAAVMNFRPLDDQFDKQTYMAAALEHSQFTEMRRAAEEHSGTKLINRGESHITLVTPPEYMRLGAKARKPAIAAVAGQSKQVHCTDT